MDKIAKKHWDVEKREASAEMAGNVMEAVYQQNGPIIDALSSTKYDDQRIARDLPVKLLIKLEMPMILDMMLQLYIQIHPM